MTQDESQEPVAWVNQSAIDWFTSDKQGSNAYVQTNLAKSKNNSATVPIFTHPPQRTWVGLTDDDEILAISNTMPYANRFEFARAIEAKLKEKNT
jgi:hypothetical protein